MSKLKISTPKRMKVVPHRPLRAFFMWVLLLIILSSTGFLSYIFGGQHAQQRTLSPSEAAALRDESSRLQGENAELKRQLATLKLAADVDRQALEELRQQLLTRREQLGEMEREISLLRLMTSKAPENSQGVGFGSFSVKPMSSEGDFQFRLVVHQLAEKAGDFKGHLEGTVVGQQAGKAVNFPLQELVIDDPKQLFTSSKIPLEFRYFQSLEAGVRLPKDFVPEYLAVKLVSNARKPLTIQQNLEWLRFNSL